MCFGALNTEQIEAFFERGFVIVPQVFSEGEIEQMREGFTRLQALAQGLDVQGEVRKEAHGAYFVLERQGTDAPLQIHRISWCGGAEPVLLDVGADERLLRPVSQLLGSRTMVHIINQAHYKMPNDQVEFCWHQDSSNRRYGTPLWDDRNGRGSYVQSAIAIDAMTRENGPLRFIPGSGRDGHLKLHEKSDEELRALYDHADRQIVEMEAGSVVFFGPFVVHSSSPNRSTAPRRLFINGYAYPGANHRSYPVIGLGRTLRLEEEPPTALAS